MKPVLVMAWVAAALIFPGALHAGESDPATTIPVLQDDRVVQLDPTDLSPVTVYLVSAKCFDNSRLVSESMVNVILGNRALIQSQSGRLEPGQTGVVRSPASLVGARRLRSLVIIDTPLEHLVLQPLGESSSPLPSDASDLAPAAYAAYSIAACDYAFAGLRMKAYCPGADTFECKVWRQQTTAGRLLKRAGELLPVYVPGETQAMQLLGSFTAALDCPDLGYVGPDGTVYGDLPPDKLYQS